MKILAILLLLNIADFSVAMSAIDHINITNVDSKIGAAKVSYVNTPAGVVMSLQLDFYQTLESMSMSLVLRRSDGDVKPGVFDPNLYTKPLFKHQVDISDLLDGKKGNFLTSTVGGALTKTFDPPIHFPLPPGTYKFVNFTIPSPIQFKLYYYNHMKYYATVKDNPKKFLTSEWHVFGRNF